MGVNIEVINPLRIEAAGLSDNSVYLVSLVEEKLGEV
jgi:hypothetical protein